MLNLVKDSDDIPPVIHEVGWKLHRSVTGEAYRRDLAYANEMGLRTYWWSGTDRNGKDMTVAWVSTSERGSVLSAYYIQEA